MKSACNNMESSRSLPILLVSAKDKEAAAAIISEIVDQQLDDKTSKSEENELNCIWRIANKYYTADVQVHALLDGEQLDPKLVDSIEAHVIYLTAEECSGQAAASVQRRAGAVSCAEVRLVAAAASAAAAPLRDAAARARLELVLLLPPAADDDDDDERGARRVRDALHAHTWRGLRRVGEAEEAAEAEEWGAWCSASGARSEALRAALAALPAAAAAARAAGGSREQRLQRAEHLVAAFCRALGDPLD